VYCPPPPDPPAVRCRRTRGPLEELLAVGRQVPLAPDPCGRVLDEHPALVAHLLLDPVGDDPRALPDCPLREAVPGFLRDDVQYLLGHTVEEAPVRLQRGAFSHPVAVTGGRTWLCRPGKVFAGLGPTAHMRDEAEIREQYEFLKEQLDDEEMNHEGVRRMFTYYERALGWVLGEKHM
jgi:hypothetical protein